MPPCAGCLALKMATVTEPEPGPGGQDRSLSPGKRLICPGGYRQAPLPAPWGLGNPSGVQRHSGMWSVWVNGRKLLEKKELLTIDLDRVYSEVGSIYNRVMGTE